MYLVDYSKWKKILIILMIINLCFILFSKFSRVFASFDYITTTPLEKNQTTVVIGNSNYGGTRTIILPEWIYDFSNICICMDVNKYNVNTKTGCIIFSNDKIFYGNNSFWSDKNTGTYYKITLSLYGVTTIDLSSRQLQDSTPWVNPSFNIDFFALPNIEGESNYNYLSFLGTIYDYNNQDTIFDQNLPFNKPVFDNSQSEIQTLDFDYLFINPRDYGVDNKLYFKLLEVTNVVENQQDASQNIYYYNDLTFSFDKNSKYIKEFFDSGTYYYALPYSALKLKKDKSYYFVLTNNNTQINQSVGELFINDNIYDIILCDTQNLITTSDEILNSIINNNPSDNTNNNINNNLPRPGYNDTDNNINIPGMNVDIPNDVTTSSFNFIFSTIYNAITSEPRPIEFSIPFIHYNFTISPYFIDEWLHQYDVTVAGGYRNLVLDLIHSFYYFIISYYILNDIRKNIEKVKSGDIMTHTDTNIKADML